MGLVQLTKSIHNHKVSTDNHNAVLRMYVVAREKYEKRILRFLPCLQYLAHHHHPLFHPMLFLLRLHHALIISQA